MVVIVWSMLLVRPIFSLFLLLSASLAGWGSEKPFGEQRLTLASQGRPTIVAMVGQKGPFSFVVDTGSSQTIFSRDLITALGEGAKPGKSVTITTASGVMSAPMFQVQEISTAGVTLEDLDVLSVAIPNSFNADGILGSDFLSNFSIEFDWVDQKFRLYRSGTLPALRGYERIHGALDTRRLFTMRGMCRNIRCRVILDTGGLVSLGNLELGRVIATTPLSQPGINFFEVKGLLTGGFKAEARVLSKLQIGGLRWTGRSIAIADLPVFSQLEDPRQPTLFLGLDLLGRGSLIIDYDRATMYLKR